MIFKNISRYDHPNIIAGQGTMGLEIIEQVPDVDAVVIPVGGGGLIAGCAVALKTMNPNIKIIVRTKNSSYKEKNIIVLIQFNHSFKLPYKKKYELALKPTIMYDEMPRDA